MLLSSLCATCLPAMAGNRLGLEPSAASRDYLANRTQFQLHTLLTEQRHPKTFELSEVAAHDVQQALSQLFSVDEDVWQAFAQLADDPQRMARLHAASAAVQQALLHGHRIYFYGTGSTGRLAETLESGLWRPFCEQLRGDPAWERIQALIPGLGDRVRGQITGGDRALISSLEGFEDLPLIGALQLQQDRIGADDVVFAVTEGGETSAVIGAALAAADQIPGRSDRVWFVYNNPDQVLRPFERSRRVLDDPRISRTHLQIRAIRGHYTVFDLNSTGGTLVNGNPVREHTLVAGDVITIGGISLIYGEDAPAWSDSPGSVTSPVGT